METSSDSVSKIPKLSGEKDYINWKRRVLAYIERYDYQLLCFQDRPSGRGITDEQILAWREANSRARTSIILTLREGPMSQVGHIVDNRGKSAKELWDSLATLYTAKNTQAIINVNQQLDNLRFKDDGNWEAHLQKFYELLGKLASYDAGIAEQDNASKLLCTLPESFSPLCMV